MHRFSITVLSAVALATGAALLSGCGASGASTPDAAAQPAHMANSTTTAGTATTLKVTAGEMFFQPKSFTAPAGKVTFQFTNAGTMEHELIVLKSDATPDSLTPGADGRVPEDASVGEVSETKAGATNSETIDLKPGSYLLVCNIAGHYAAGMQATLVVS